MELIIQFLLLNFDSAAINYIQLHNQDDNLRHYFKTEDEELKVRLIRNREGTFPAEVVEHQTGLRLMISDIKNEKSYLYNLLKPFYVNDDKVEQKMNMFYGILENYIDTFFAVGRSMSEPIAYKSDVFVSAYDLRVHYRIPKDRVIPSLIDYTEDDLNKMGVPLRSECTNCINYCLKLAEKDKPSIDLSKLNDQDIIKYILPIFYNTIGAPNLKDLRKDLETMNALSLNWFDKITLGYLD